VARRADISTGYLAKIERGSAARPSADVLDRLARALETTVADLLERTTYVEPAAVPESLRRFAEHAGLADEDVRMLAGISYRGQQPRTPDDWHFLFEAIKRSITGSPE
jgi:transcriptional regulator with XRE-family HTH domain